MKTVFFLSYLLKGAIRKIEGKITDWSCKMYSTCGKDTFFKGNAEIGNLSKQKERIQIGEYSIIEGKLLIFSYGGEIKIGNYVYIGNQSQIWSGDRITIGNNVLISHNVNIMDTNSHEINYIERESRYKHFLKNGYPNDKGSVETKLISIEDNVWISFGVTILKGVTIGKGSIVAANSVVTKDVPAFSLVAGNPAKTIKKLDQ